MKPTKRTVPGEPGPDKRGDADKIGGTNGDIDERKSPEQGLEGDEGGGGGYGRPREQDVSDARRPYETDEET